MDKKLKLHSPKTWLIYLLLVLLAMFLTASTVQNIYIIVAGMVVIAAGELVRLLRLPKDITAHLTDTGLRER